MGTEVIHALKSRAHIDDTVAILEEALADARGGQLASVVVFADVKGKSQLKTYKSGSEDWVTLVGKLMHSIFELCCEPK
jgi:hypothetical protein